jgi:tetratricopeptide (TPR) repeat protein
MNLATSFLARGWHQQTIKLLTNITLPKTFREGALARYALARAYTMQEDYEKAINELDAVIADRPDLTVVYKNQGTSIKTVNNRKKRLKSIKNFWKPARTTRPPEFNWAWPMKRQTRLMKRLQNTRSFWKPRRILP